MFGGAINRWEKLIFVIGLPSKKIWNRLCNISNYPSCMFLGNSFYMWQLCDVLPVLICINGKVVVFNTHLFSPEKELGRKLTTVASQSQTSWGQPEWEIKSLENAFSL